MKLRISPSACLAHHEAEENLFGLDPVLPAPSHRLAFLDLDAVDDLKGGPRCGDENSQRYSRHSRYVAFQRAGRPRLCD